MIVGVPTEVKNNENRVALTPAGTMALTQAGDGLDDTQDRVRAKFPTTAIAVQSWRGAAWRDLAPGAALLTSVTVPRGGQG